MLAKLQTHWAKMPKIGHFEAMGLHFGGIGGRADDDSHQPKQCRT